MPCPLCRQRKAKRACPALGQPICAACCGAKRLVEIACPSDCVFLESAERHPPAVIRRQQEHDLAVLMSTVGRLSDAQLQVFLLLHEVTQRFEPDGLTRLVDADLAEAAGALASTYETASRGVLYEHRAQSTVAEALRRTLQTLLDELGRGGSGFDREIADVLRSLERGARHEGADVGDGPTAYLDLVARLMAERPSLAGPRGDRSGGGPSIVLP